MEPLRPTSVVRFGTYEVSLQSGEVRKAGLRIRVQQQPMKLLETLLEQVRITAQLIQAPADKHLWAESYEGNLRDTLALQKRVANTIAERIRIEVTPQEQAVLKKANVVNPVAYESYLKGRYFWNKRTPDGLKVAMAYFKQAIEEDPTNAQAYAGLADTYNLLGDWEYGALAPSEAYPKGKAAAIKALELDNALGEAHTSLAFSLDVFDWD